jgi:hypothetical protein
VEKRLKKELPPDWTVVDRPLKPDKIESCRPEFLNERSKLYIPWDVAQSQQMKPAMQPMDKVVQNNSFSPTKSSWEI